MLESSAPLLSLTLNDILSAGWQLLMIGGTVAWFYFRLKAVEKALAISMLERERLTTENNTVHRELSQDIDSVRAKVQERSEHFERLSERVDQSERRLEQSIASMGENLRGEIRALGMAFIDNRRRGVA